MEAPQTYPTVSWATLGFVRLIKVLLSCPPPNTKLIRCMSRHSNLTDDKRQSGGLVRDGPAPADRALGQKGGDGHPARGVNTPPNTHISRQTACSATHSSSLTFYITDLTNSALFLPVCAPSTAKIVTASRRTPLPNTMVEYHDIPRSSGATAAAKILPQWNSTLAFHSFLAIMFSYSPRPRHSPRCGILLCIMGISPGLRKGHNSCEL